MNTKLMNTKSLFAMTLAGLVCVVSGCASSAEPDAESDEGALATPDATTASPQSPAVGTPERKALMAALHAKIDPDLKGQKSEYVVSWLQSAPSLDGKGSYAFIMGNVRGVGKAKLDWSKTKYAEDVADGLFDGGHMEALARRDAQGTWTILAHGIGSTDVWWVGLPSENPNAPKSIYPFVEE